LLGETAAGYETANFQEYIESHKLKRKMAYAAIFRFRIDVECHFDETVLSFRSSANRMGATSGRYVSLIFMYACSRSVEKNFF